MGLGMCVLDLPRHCTWICADIHPYIHNPTFLFSFSSFVPFSSSCFYSSYTFTWPHLTILHGFLVQCLPSQLLHPRESLWIFIYFFKFQHQIHWILTECEDFPTLLNCSQMPNLWLWCILPLLGSNLYNSWIDTCVHAYVHTCIHTFVHTSIHACKNKSIIHLYVHPSYIHT